MIDISLDQRGDLAVGADGDLILFGGARAIIQAIKFRLADSDVNKMLGDPLNSKVLRRLEGRVKDVISGILPADYFKLRAVPLARDQAGIFLTIYAKEEASLAISITAKGITFTEE